jgi:hypothetical protein
MFFKKNFLWFLCFAMAAFMLFASSIGFAFSMLFPGYIVGGEFFEEINFADVPKNWTVDVYIGIVNVVLFSGWLLFLALIAAGVLGMLNTAGKINLPKSKLKLFARLLLTVDAGFQLIGFIAELIRAFGSFVAIRSFGHLVIDVVAGGV